MAKINFKNFMRVVYVVFGYTVVLLCMVIAVCAMLAADVIALFVYPLYATLAPKQAADIDSISGWIGFKWLKDLCEIGTEYNLPWPINWLHLMLNFLDNVVIVFLKWVAAWTAPMRIRFWFIDVVNIHKPSIQKKYFQMSNDREKIELIKYGRLDKDVLLDLFRENHELFIKAGKVEDEWFCALGIEESIRYSTLYTLSACKMKVMLQRSDDVRVAGEVVRIIRRNGLSVEVLNFFHVNIKPERVAYKSIKNALKDHEQAVTVLTLQTGVKADSEKFVEYIKLNNGLGTYAQTLMSVYQYRLFRNEGYKMDTEVVNSKLRAVARDGYSSRSAHFIPAFVQYHEIADNDEVARDIIASSEVLTKMIYA